MLASATVDTAFEHFEHKVGPYLVAADIVVEDLAIKQAFTAVESLTQAFAASNLGSVLVDIPELVRLVPA